MKLQLYRKNKHVGIEVVGLKQERTGNTLAPSCGITVLEVQQLHWKRNENCEI